MVRRHNRPNRDHLPASNPNGWIGIPLDSNPHLVPRSYLSSGLCESGSSNAPGGDRIRSGDPADSNILDDSIPVFNRRLPTRPVRVSLRSSSAPWRSRESCRKRVGPLQADGIECLENVQDLQPLSFSALSRNDSRCCVESLG